MNDRKLGYAVLVLVAGGVLAASIYFVQIAFFPSNHRVIAFSDLGSNTQVDETISIRGVAVGTVHKIQRNKRDRNSFVTVEFTRNFQIHEDYSVENIEVGFMGDRKLILDCGTKEYPLVGARDTLVGIFRPGISEAMGEFTILKELVDSVSLVIDGAMKGTADREPLPALFKRVVTQIDAASIQLSSILAKGTHTIPAVLDTLDRISGRLGEVTDSASDYVPVFLASTSEFLSGLDSLEDSLASFLRLTDTFLDKAVDGEALLRPKLKRLKSQIGKVSETVADIRQKGFPLNVRVMY